MPLHQLLWDVVFVVSLDGVGAYVLFNHFNVHVSDAEAENVIFELRVSNLWDGVLKDVIAHLLVEVIVGVLIEIVQFGELGNLNHFV